MKYFDIKEMCVSGSHPLLVEIPKPGTYVYNNLVRLIETVLDPIREKIGKPIRVTSGYRSPKLNAAVGGSKTSAHTAGNASDLVTGNCGSDNLKIVKALLELGLKTDQVIIENPTFNSKGEIVSAKWIHIGLSDKMNRGQMLYYNGKSYLHLKVKTDFTFTK